MSESLQSLLHFFNEVKQQNTIADVAHELAMSNLLKYGVFNANDPSGPASLMFPSSGLDFFNALAQRSVTLMQATVPNYNPDTFYNYAGLLHVAGNGMLTSVQHSIAAGVNIDGWCAKNKTPLMAAATHGHLDVIEYLLSKGADLNKLSSKHETALMLAAGNGKLAIVKLLVDKGAKLNDRDVWGDTALLVAAKYDFPEVVEYLLSKNVDVSDNDLEIIMRSATKNSNIEVLMLFLRRHNQEVPLPDYVINYLKKCIELLKVKDSVDAIDTAADIEPESVSDPNAANIDPESTAGPAEADFTTVAKTTCKTHRIKLLLLLAEKYNHLAKNALMQAGFSSEDANEIRNVAENLEARSFHVSNVINIFNAEIGNFKCAGPMNIILEYANFLHKEVLLADQENAAPGSSNAQKICYRPNIAPFY